MTLSAVELVAAVRGGEVSAQTAAERALQRIEQVDASIGAFQVVRTVAAIREAQEVDARPDKASLPLAGLPIAIKDNVPVEGEPMRFGSTASDPAPQPADHEVVRRLRDAGAVVVGLTRAPELCVFGATDSRFGLTRNPWNRSRTPGGSSVAPPPPWPQAWWLWRTATMAWARSASPRRAAASWSCSSTSARDLAGATTRTLSPRRNFGGKRTSIAGDSSRAVVVATSTSPAMGMDLTTG